MKYLVEIGGKELEVELFKDEGAIWAKIGGKNKKIKAELIKLPESKLYTLFFGNRAKDLYLNGNGGNYKAQLAGQDYELKVQKALIKGFKQYLKPGREEAARREATEAILANMPGLVVKAEVTKGQEVKEGDGLFIIDAMKMENEIRSPCNGVVEEVSVEEGEEIEKGQLLCRIRAKDEK